MITSVLWTRIARVFSVFVILSFEFASFLLFALSSRPPPSPSLFLSPNSSFLSSLHISVHSLDRSIPLALRCLFTSFSSHITRLHIYTPTSLICPASHILSHSMYNFLNCSQQSRICAAYIFTIFGVPLFWVIELHDMIITFLSLSRALSLAVSHSRLVFFIAFYFLFFIFPLLLLFISKHTAFSQII